MKIVFNPFTGTFDFVQPREDNFFPLTTFDCGRLDNFDEDCYDEIDCGDLGDYVQVRKLDMGELG